MRATLVNHFFASAPRMFPMRHGCRSILPLAARKIGQNASRQPIIPPFGDKKRGAVKKPKVFSQPLVAGEQASPPYTPPGTIEARKGFGSTIRHGRPAAPDGLQYSLAHWASASPVSATGGGEAPPLSRSPLGFLTVCVQRALASRAIYIWNFTQLA